MKIPLFFAKAALFAALLAPSVTSPTSAAPAPTFTSKKDGYAIDLPGKPTAASRTMSLPGQGQSTVNFISFARPPLTFVVIPMKLPRTPTAANTANFLQGIERGFTKSTSAKLISSKKISLNGAAGREILAQAGTNLMRGRFFVKGDRSYQVIAVSPKNGEARYRAQVMRVLDSFRILS